MGRGSKHQDLDAEIDDVVRGRARVTLERLVALIDRINPTARDASQREREARYAQKSRLQSLLIREHPEIVRVVLVDEVTIALSLDGTGRHAAHARIDALDEDARSWVQRKLDTPDEADAPPSVRSPSNAAKPRTAAPSGDSVAFLITQGDAAQQAYDYERARDCFEAAVLRGGGREAETKLIELLVGVLVDDRSALERAATLGGAALEHGPIKIALATAEARAGSLDRAHALLAATEHSGAALAWVEIGTRGLREGNVAAATRAAARARSLDPALVAVARLELDLQSYRDDQLGVLESRLTALAIAGNEDATLALARDILRDHPGSKVAAAMKRKLEGARAAQSAAALLAHARAVAMAARSIEEIDRAVTALREASRAAAVGLDVEIDALTAKRRALRVDIDARSLAARMSSRPLTEEQLLDWVASADEVRAAARVDHEVVRWLEELAPPPSGTRARAAARAVLALERARALVQGGRDHAALSALDEHPVLRDLTAAAELRATIQRGFVAAAADALARTMSAFARGELEKAQQIAGALDPSLLPDDAARAELASLTQRIEGERAHAARNKALSDAIASEDFIAARAALREVLASASDDERERLQSTTATIETGVLRTHELVCVDGAVPELDGRDLDPHSETWCMSLDESATRAVVGSMYGQQAFLRIFELGSTQHVVPSRCVALRTPFALDQGSISTTSGHIALVSGRGARLHLAWNGREILDVVPAPKVALPRNVLRSTLLPDGATIWAQGYTKEDLSDLVLQVIDARTGRVRNTTSGLGAYNFSPGSKGLRIWGTRKNELERFDMDARPLGTKIVFPGKLVSYASAVGDDGLWVLGRDAELSQELGARIARYDERGNKRAELRLNDAVGSVWSELFPVRGGCFVRAPGERAMCRLWALRDHGDHLEVSWAIDAPDAAALVGSMVAEDIWVVHLGQPIAMWKLELDAPPTLPNRPPERDEPVAPGAHLFAPPWRSDGVREVLAQRARRVAEAQRDGALDDLVHEQLLQTDPAELVADALALGAAHGPLARQLFKRAQSLAPDERQIARDHAQLCISIGEYRDAVAIVDAALRRRPAPDHDAMLEIPLAVARYCLGDIDGARSALVTALGRMHARHAEEPRARLFAEFLERAYGPNAASTRVGRRVLALADAHRAAARGDVRGAIAGADVADVWRPRESSALTMLAELWSQLAPTTWGENIRRVLVLAAAERDPSEPRGPLVLPGRPLSGGPL